MRQFVETVSTLFDMQTATDYNSQGTRMLIVEDDPTIGRELKEHFNVLGYSVTLASEGIEAIRLFKQPPLFDIAVMDVMLPKKNGFEVLREARQAGIETPVLILSARSSEKDKIRGFNLGADDYVTKPFSTEELAARVRVILKRSSNNRQEPVEECSFGDITINFSSHTALRAGSSIQFTALEFSILRYFIRNNGRTVSRKQLLRDVWGIEGDIATRTIDRHVASLRKKIEPDSAEPKFIQTVYGIGYKFSS